MSRVYVLLLAALLALLATGCGSGSKSSSGDTPSVPDDAAAVVGGITIPKDRLDGLMEQAKVVYKRTKRPFPAAGTSAYKALRARATAYLVVGAMYEARAKDEGIEATQEEIDAEVANIKRTAYGKTAAAQEKEMKAQGMTEDELAAQARLKVVENKVQRKVFAGVKVTDADVKADYEKNKSHYTVAESRDIRQILVHSAKKARELRNLLLAGSDFATLAKKYSEDRPSARGGGKATITKGQTTPAFDAVAFSIATGKISDVIVTQYGWQILQAISPVKPAVVTTLDEVDEQIRRQLLETRQRAALGQWQLGAKREFCKGKIAYDADYKPFPDDNPCRANSQTG